MTTSTGTITNPTSGACDSSRAACTESWSSSWMSSACSQVHPKHRRRRKPEWSAKPKIRRKMGLSLRALQLGLVIAILLVIFFSDVSCSANAKAMGGGGSRRRQQRHLLLHANNARSASNGGGSRGRRRHRIKSPSSASADSTTSALSHNSPLKRHPRTRGTSGTQV